MSRCARRSISTRANCSPGARFAHSSAADRSKCFKVGQSFFEPPGATHIISANASNTEPAELVAVYVADEGAQLTTFLD
jgi:hypothetical protein